MVVALQLASYACPSKPIIRLRDTRDHLVGSFQQVELCTLDFILAVTCECLTASGRIQKDTNISSIAGSNNYSPRHQSGKRKMCSHLHAQSPRVLGVCSHPNYNGVSNLQDQSSAPPTVQHAFSITCQPQISTPKDRATQGFIRVTAIDSFVRNKTPLE